MTLAVMETAGPAIDPAGDAEPRPAGAARPRALFVNRSYWPDVEATGQLLTELCEDLAGEFDVHVLCGQPGKLAGDAEFAARGTCIRNGVTIHRVRHTRFDKASFWGRLANMLSFQAASAWQALSVPRPDVVVTETDPPFLCLLGSLLKRLRGCRHVCYLQDIYPDVAVALGKLRDGAKTRLLRRMFFRSYRRSDAVIVLSRDMRELIVDGGVPAERVHIVPNWVDVDAVYPVKENNRFRHVHGLEDKFVVMYSGNMGLSQRLDQVLEAAELLRDREDVVFAFVGDGADRRNLERRAGACATGAAPLGTAQPTPPSHGRHARGTPRDLPNVRFFDYQPKAELADSLSAADVHLVILRPEIKRLLMPSKLYGVLASGTPAVVIADADCELAGMVREHGFGEVVPSDDVEALAAAIRTAAASPETNDRCGADARRYAEIHCTREKSSAGIRELLGSVVGVEDASWASRACGQ